MSKLVIPGVIASAGGSGGGGGDITVDSELSTTSTNPVQNKIITAALEGKVNLTGSNVLVGTLDITDDPENLWQETYITPGNIELYCSGSDNPLSNIAAVKLLADELIEFKFDENFEIRSENTHNQDDPYEKQLLVTCTYKDNAINLVYSPNSDIVLRKALYNNGTLSNIQNVLWDDGSVLTNKATTQTGSDASLILFPWNEYSIAAKGSVFIGPNNGTIVTQGNHDTLVGAGPSANAANGDCTAVGYNAQAGGQGSTSIGSGSSANGQYGVSVGKDTKCNESGSVAIGLNANVSGGNNAIAIGNGAKTDQSGSYSGSYRIAIGTNAYATAYNAIAIGSGGTNNTSAKASNKDSIQLGQGTNSTAKTLQVYEWPLLDGNTGKIPAERLPSIGGAPTITWYKGNTGTTVTIADTTNATLVKVYKNGLLLEPSIDDSDGSDSEINDYSISGTTLTLTTALVSTDKIAVEVF